VVLPWRAAWQRALYAEEQGFYRRVAGPAGHFTTSSHGILGIALARALVVLARQEGLTRFVDVGCGRGELLRAVHGLGPDLELVGVDVVARPGALPEGARWVMSSGGPDLPDLELGTTDAGADQGGLLVVANEWLDVVPCTVAEVDDGGTLREVLVDPATGVESLGGPVADVDLGWVEAWWPKAAPGERVEVGRSRDEAWQGLLERLAGLGRVVAVAIDYGHTVGNRPAGGTLTAYRDGVQTGPVPDGSMDITAHVAMDSLPHDELMTQRRALADLGTQTERPPHELARRDPAAYLRGLSAHSASSALAGEGFGDFLWAVSRLG
jgi:SAM-dependent MidA family methyltransferase